MIAFLGTGLLGSNFVKALLRNGHAVQVWNRTHERALPLEADGAGVLRDVADAVRDADRIHLTLKDDEAVNEVLEKAAGALRTGAFIIDHTTTSAEGAKERTEKWKEQGIHYLHVPVFMGPQNALECTGTMLVSGDPELIAQVEPGLAKMTGKVLHFGTQTNRAAGIKLLGNLFLVALTAGLADMLALAGALGVPSDDVKTLFESWNPAGIVPMRLQRMTSGDFGNPSWELNMARKDVRLMTEAAAAGNVTLTITPVIGERMDRFIAAGHGASDWTVIGS